MKLFNIKLFNKVPEQEACAVAHEVFGHATSKLPAGVEVHVVQAPNGKKHLEYRISQAIYEKALQAIPHVF